MYRQSELAEHLECFVILTKPLFSSCPSTTYNLRPTSYHSNNPNPSKMVVSRAKEMKLFESSSPSSIWLLLPLAPFLGVASSKLKWRITKVVFLAATKRRSFVFLVVLFGVGLVSLGTLEDWCTYIYYISTGVGEREAGECETGPIFDVMIVWWHIYNYIHHMWHLGQNDRHDRHSQSDITINVTSDRMYRMGSKPITLSSQASTEHSVRVTCVTS